MRLFALALAAALSGCALPAAPAEPPALDEARVVGISVTPACVARGAPLEVKFTIVNPTALAGRVSFAAFAAQYGYIARGEVDLAAEETREVTRGASIDQASVWTVYAVGPNVEAGQVQVRVVDPGAAGGARCP